MDSRPVPVTLGKGFFLSQRVWCGVFFCAKSNKEDRTRSRISGKCMKRSFLKDHMLIFSWSFCDFEQWILLGLGKVMGDNVTPGPSRGFYWFPSWLGRLWFFGGKCHFFLKTLSSGFLKKESFWVQIHKICWSKEIISWDACITSQYI